MSLGFLAATDENLGDTDNCVSTGQISIQCQRPLAFGNALGRAVGIDLDAAQNTWAKACSGANDSALVKAASAAASSAARSSAKKPLHARKSTDAVPTNASILPGSLAKARSKNQALASCARSQSLIHASHALKIEVHRVGMRCLFRAARLGGDQLRAQLIGKPRDDFVLHVEEVGHGLIEALGPEMRAGLRVDELDVDAQPIAGALNAALQHIPHVQLAPDLLQIDMFSLVGEGSVAPDHERAGDAREIGGQALRHAIDEIFLLWIAAEIGEGQDHDGEAWRTCLFWCGQRCWR